MIFWPLLLCFFSACFFTGLIWMIQIVQYPGFALVGPVDFPAFHAAHSQRISIVLALPFLVNLSCSILLFWFHPADLPSWSIWLNLLLTIAVWLMTALIHVPLHRSLGQAYSLLTIRSLVATNWLRTITWTLQSFLLLSLLALALHAL